MITTDVLIIGAGLSGLSAAYHLEGKKNYILIEQENKVGGLASSVEKNGFIFDYSGHLLHMHKEETKKFIFSLLKDNLNCIKRNSWIYLNGVYTPYPFQANLYNLPTKVKTECVTGFLKAYTANLKPSALSLQPAFFYEWSLKTFGKGICKYFMFPYNLKLWCYPLNKLTTEWCAPFVPVPSVQDVLEGAYLRKKENIGYNPVFYYPGKGGIQALANAISQRLKNIELNSEITSVDLKNKIAWSKKLGFIKYETLVNTVPLKNFVHIIENTPEKIKKLNSKLKHNTVYVLNIGAKKTGSKMHWAYFSEEDFVFYRAGIGSNFSKHVAPSGYTSFYIEVATRNKLTELLQIESKIIQGLIKSNLITNEKDIVEKMWFKIPFAYVIYDSDRAAALPIIFNWLRSHNVFSIGRYGAWKYSFMEECILDGKETAEKIINNIL